MSGWAAPSNGRVGDAGQQALEVGRGFLVAQDSPDAGVKHGHKQQNGGDNAHRG